MTSRPTPASPRRAMESRLEALIPQPGELPLHDDRFGHLDRDEIAWLLVDAALDQQPKDSLPALPRLPRLALLIHRSRPDLQRAFPDPLGRSRRGLAHWYITDGRLEYGLRGELVRPVLRDHPLRTRVASSLRHWRHRLRSRSAELPAAPPDVPPDVPAVRGEQEAAAALDTAPATAPPPGRLEGLHDTWEALAQSDPLWAILSAGGKRYGRWDLEEFFETGREEIASTLGDLEAMGLRPDPRAALDFGCGAGRLTRGLARHFDHAVGIDISETMIHLAEGHAEEDNVAYVHNRRNDLGVFADRNFTFIYTGRVLQHIPPEISRGYIREFLRVLAADGIAVFQVPSTERGDPRTSALPEEAYAAGIEVVEAPESMVSGGDAALRVRLTNLSPVTWPSVGELGICQIRLANQWLSPEGDVVLADDGRTGLEENLPPGESRDLVLVVSGPPEPGTYRCWLDLVQEFVAWFSSKGSAPAEFTITVRPAESRGASIASSTEKAQTLSHDIEMHTLPREEVYRLIEESGGEIVEVHDDELAGPEWISLRYHVRKNPFPPPCIPPTPAAGRRLARLRPVNRDWTGLLATEIAADDTDASDDTAARDVAPLNAFLEALWRSRSSLRDAFPLDSLSSRTCLLYWLALRDDPPLQSWLLAAVDWGWFDRPAPNVADAGEEPISNLLWLLRAVRPDLRGTRGLETAEGRRRLRTWASAGLEREHGRELARITEKISRQSPEGGRPVPRSAGSFAPGAHLVEPAWPHPEAFEVHGIPHGVVSVFNSEEDPQRAEDEFRYRANLVPFGTDQLLPAFGQLGPQLWNGRVTIGVWPAEQPFLPPEWTPSFDLVDEIWVPTRFLCETLSRVSPVPVLHMPPPVVVELDGAASRVDDGLPDAAFLFLTSCETNLDGLARHNPMAAIEAFQRAFPENGRDEVVLVIQAAHPDAAHPDAAHPEWRDLLARVEADARLHLVDEHREPLVCPPSGEPRRWWGLLHRADAYVSLHRAVGFGHDVVEAMLLDTPVIATDGAGTRDYCSASTTCLVDGWPVPVDADRAGSPMWAEPDLDQAVEAMRRLLEDAPYRRQIARTARRVVRSAYNPFTVGRRCGERLRALDLL